ncbi:MAG: cytochrome c peroxidase [Myxococcota bacterium]|nr:cytochrome c peroxidase [Myxococcota bacterium]
MRHHAVRRSLVGLLAASLLSAAPSPSTETTLRERAGSFVRPSAVPHPSDNPWTADRERLGRTLFFDPRLSASGTISCATCHNPSFEWGDGLALGVGHAGKQLARRTPTILNVAWGAAFFWDGRASTLEEQALGPIQAEGEMNLPLEELVARLRGIDEYAALFEAAYPGEPISEDVVAKAIAVFERTVVSAPAPFDRWVEGDDDAIGPAAIRGFELFTGKARCSVCHTGWRFTDDSFHDVGTRSDDLGRGVHLPEILVSQHAFKTPTLRNVERRAPYMHNGSEPTLEAVIESYVLGGRETRPSLSNEIRPLDLDGTDRADLLAFLATLTSDGPPESLPRMPR